MTRKRMFRRLGQNWGGIKKWTKAHWTRVARRHLNGGSRALRRLGEE